MDIRAFGSVAAGWAALFGVAVGLLPPETEAECTPAGTPKADTIVCSGTDTQGVDAGSGDDQVTVLSGADVSVQSSGTATTSVAIDTGAGNDTVLNYGKVTLSLTGASGTSVSGGRCGGWDPNSNTARGIYGASGKDTLSNHGTLAVSSFFTFADQALARTGASCAPSLNILATGLEGGESSDLLTNAGNLFVSATLQYDAPASLSTGAPSPAPEVPAVQAIGMLGGNGEDQLHNDGALTVTATNAVAGGAAQATGMVGGNSGGEIVNGGTMSVTATTSDSGPASAVGIVGGNGKDSIENDGTLNVNAVTTLDAVTKSLSLSGGDDVTATTELEASAVGIDAGNGKDSVLNSGAVNVGASATLNSVNAELNLIDTSHANTSTTVRASAIGIDGGNGPDDIAITNGGMVAAQANARSNAVNVEVDGVDAGTADSTLDVTAVATGIAAGRGKDPIDNSGAITAGASATANDVSVTATFVDATIADNPGNLSTAVNAYATGIDTGQARDELDLTNTGTLGANATANAKSIGVSVASEGVPGSTQTLFETGALASIGINSYSEAHGVLSGGANDQLTSAGDITASSTATATQASINVGIAIFDFKLPTPGLVLGSAGTGADALAVGIDTGRGNDMLSNTGKVDVDANASADATTVSVNLAEFSVDFLPGVPGVPAGASLVVADTSTESSATARGVVSGDGNDTLTNAGTIASNATATSGSTSASATLNTKFGKGDNFFTLNAVAAHAVTSADADAVGVDTGDGKDHLVNDGGISVGALADANAVSVGVDVAGTVRGKGGAASVALTDSSSQGIATAAGIRAGDGNDEIVNRGAIDVSAGGNVDSISASVTAGIAKQGLVAGAALADSESIAGAEALGIDAGAGKDDILNTAAIGARAHADADAVSVGVTVEGTTQGLVGGAALADVGTTATATAVGIRTGTESGPADGKYMASDTSCHPCAPTAAVTNNGTISADAEANALAVGVSANVGIVTKDGAALGAALARTSSTANATATGIAADANDDAITNAGDIGLRDLAHADAVSVSLNVEGTARGLTAGASLVDASVKANATATGIDAGAGDDQVENTGTIGTLADQEIKSDATAVGVSAGAQLTVKEGASLGAALADTSAKATTIATGISAGAGDDEVHNVGDIALSRVAANADAISVSLDVALAKEGLAVGAALSNSDSTAQTTVTGIDGGSGNDHVVNDGTIHMQQIGADADAVSVGVSIAGAKDGVALGAALVDADGTARLNMAGLLGGDGRDDLKNNGSIILDGQHASADATGVSVGITFSKEGAAVAAALAETGTTARANVFGLDGGNDDDHVINSGTVQLQHTHAEAGAVSVSVGLAGAQDGVAISAGLADASGNAKATATGLGGGSGDDLVINSGKLQTDDLRADAHATGVSVQLAGVNAGVAAGVTLTNTSAKARTAASGIDGASGDDFLSNSGDITLNNVHSHADAVSVGVSLNAALSGGVAAGAALSDASATAKTRAIGMSGGSGDDWVINKGTITADGIGANTDSTSVSAQLGVTNAGVALGAALVDTEANSRTMAVGLDGAAGDDNLFNSGTVTLRNVYADADAVSVGVSLNAALSGGVAAGVSLVDGSGTAKVDVAGMRGGDGRDQLTNLGTLRAETVEADAHATGVSVTLNASMAGVAAGAALADTSATARTTVTGLEGGAGDDELVNGTDGVIDMQGKARADAFSLAFKLSGSVGVAGGAAITDASSTADSTVVGIDGGAGDDQIENDGSVTAASRAEAESTAISLSVSIGIGGDVSLADARSTANATAVGINDTGDATISADNCRSDGSKHGCDYPKPPINTIANRGPVTATSSVYAKGTSVSGNLFGFALGETTNGSSATASGILTGDSRDLLLNQGAITAGANAVTEGLAVAVSLGGKSLGDASSSAQATAEGIDTGAYDDVIENRASIGVTAGANARATSVSVGLIGVSEADATTTATANAVGIASGTGDDQVTNYAAIDVSAGRPDLRDGSGNCTEVAGGACGKASMVSVTLAGYGNADAGVTASAGTVGLDGGAGNDVLDNLGSVTTSALARGRADSTSVVLAGATDVNATSAANAAATAMNGGTGNDELDNSGTLDTHAAAETYVRSFAFTLFGSASSAGSSVTNASAFAINGGDGSDHIVNSDAGTIKVQADTQSTVSSSSWNFAGGAAAKATLGALTEATGIDGGAGADWIGNFGALEVKTQSQMAATGGAKAIFGGAATGSKITATTSATGIDAGADDDVIKNAGKIDVDANANMLANTTSASFAGGAATTEFVTAEAKATAIATGTGADRVYNDGEARAGVNAIARTNGSSSTDLGGSARASGTVAADVTANGIDGSAGAAVVINHGTVAATAIGEAWATHSSDSGVFFSNAGVVANSSARLTADGITLGAGDNVVKNSGTVEVSVSTGSDDWYGDGVTEGIYARADADGSDFDIFLGNGDAAGTVSASGTVSMNGIAVGAGDNYIANDGHISVRTAEDGVKATAFSDPNGGGFTIDGDGAGTANTTLALDARGIVAADGELHAVNHGEIAVDVAPAASSGVDADGGSSGDADVFVDARVTSSAIGIAGGSGEHWVANSGAIAVRNAASASVHGDANGQGADGDGRVGFGIALSQQPGYARVDAVTAGIDLGAGRSRVAQEGTVSLTDDTASNAWAYADSDFTGGANGFARGEIGSDAYAVRTAGADSWIENSGAIDISATPHATSYAAGYASGNGSRAYGTANALTYLDSNVRGLLAEGANSQIVHTGSIAIDAQPSVTARAEAESNLDGDSRATATATIDASAIGIETLGAGSTVAQLGTIDVSIAGSGTATTFSDTDGALAGTRAYAVSTSQLNVRGVGVHVADAAGDLSNDGDIDIVASAATQTGTNTVAPGLPKGVENNYSLATAEAFGMQVGTAQTSLGITNAGNITVDAASVAQVSTVGSTYMHTEERAIARGIGILAEGETNYSVINMGTIKATASATSDWNDLGLAPIADAVGIRSGSGNDTIINRGTITATNTVNGVTSAGTAIDAGAGDDLVELDDGSVTNGDIVLGTGADTLSLEGTPVINGNIIDELSTVSLLFNNSGSYDGGLPGLTAIKNGYGTFTLSALNRMERIEVNQGTLRLTRDYQFLPNGLFQARVYGDGSHGQFLVDGQAGLDGKLRVVRGDGVYLDGRTYDVLQAGGITAGTAFTDVELPAPSRLVSFSVQQGADAVEVGSAVASFTTVSASGNPSAVAKHLDDIAPRVTGELSRTLGTIQTLSSDADFATAFASLSPAVYEHYSLASLSGPRQYGQTLDERMTALRVSELSVPSAQPLQLAYDGSSGSLQRLLADTEDQTERPYGLWVKAFAQQGEQNAFADVSAYDHKLSGFAIGIDQRFGRAFMAGISYGQARNTVKADIDHSDADIDSKLFAVYGSYFDQRLYVNGTLSAGRNDYDTDRTIVVGSTTTPVTSTHQGDVLTASLGTGYYLRAGESWLDPFVNFQYTRLKEDGFSEDGSAAGLVVAARTTRALVSNLGLRWSRMFAAKNGATWTPEASLAWLHDFDKGGHLINASYVGAPDASFSIAGQPVEQNGALLGLGVTYRTSGGLATFLRYTGEFRDHYTAHGVIGELRYEF